MIRFFDILISLFSLILLSPILLIILIIGYFDTGYPIIKQCRMGKFKRPFLLLKFRSMYLNTQSVATHLASPSSVTPFGKFLRKSKLDELPQLVNVLLGDMSIVGPRPNLFNQVELTEIRDSLNVYSVKPGITGLSQINKIDMSQPILLAETDLKMIKNMGLVNYFKFILITLTGKGFGDRIKN